MTELDTLIKSLDDLLNCVGALTIFWFIVMIVGNFKSIMYFPDCLFLGATVGVLIEGGN